jgi:hypothetical protein
MKTDIVKPPNPARSEVTNWFKRHAALPKKQRDALEAPHADQITKEVASDAARRASDRAAAAASAADGDAGGSLRREAAPRGGRAAAPAPAPAPVPGSLLQPVKGKDTGYIPFGQRGRGDGGPRRLAADVLRTLEALYVRSPYPSKDMVQSFCDMHRVPR